MKMDCKQCIIGKTQVKASFKQIEKLEMLAII